MGNFGQALAVPAVPLPMALSTETKIRILYDHADFLRFGTLLRWDVKWLTFVSLYTVGPTTFVNLTPALQHLENTPETKFKCQEDKQLSNILDYRIVKIYCHINQWDASVQYFAILDADKYCILSRKSIALKIHSLWFLYLRINVAVPCDIVCSKKHLSRDI